MMKQLKIILLAILMVLMVLPGKATNKNKKLDFSIQQVMKEANAGSADAQCFLGYCMIEGINTEVDYKKAAYWLSKAVAQGNKPALYYLTTIRYAIDGMEQEFKNVADCLRKQNNNLSNQNDDVENRHFSLVDDHMGRINYSQLSNDDYSTQELYSQATNDNPTAQYIIAGVLAGLGERQQSLKWLNRAAELGHAEAQYSLAIELSRNGAADYVLDYRIHDATINADVIKWLQAAADQGCLSAIIALANCYASDNEFHDDSKAAKYYIQAANLGDKESQLIAGNYYYLGKGVPLNYTEAMKWYNLASFGCWTAREANSHMGDCFFYGKGVQQNYNKAIKYYDKANDADAYYTLATYYDSNHDQAKALKYYLLTADYLSCLGYDNKACKAALILADRYYNGTYGLNQDYKQAAYYYTLGNYESISKAEMSSAWFKMYYELKYPHDDSEYVTITESSDDEDEFKTDLDKYATNNVVKQARQGNPQAQLKLGKKLMGAVERREGEEDPIPEIQESFYDKKQAAIWLRKAANHGNAEAQYYLGYCLSLMNVGEEDESVQKEILGLYEKAAKAGFVKAQVALAQELEAQEWRQEYSSEIEDEFDGSEEDQDWWVKAAQNGDAHAQMRMGTYEWLSKAAQQGCLDACKQLAECYFEGIGVARNVSKGVEWLTTAANAGSGVAAHELAYRYYKGEGVEQDYKKAVYWYSISANDDPYEGEPCSCGSGTEVFDTDVDQNILGQCYRDGIGVARDYKKAVFWFRLAAERGNTDAQRNLSECYKQGFGVPVSSSQAEWWLELSKRVDRRNEINSLQE